MLSDFCGAIEQHFSFIQTIIFWQRREATKIMYFAACGHSLHTSLDLLLYLNAKYADVIGLNHVT